MKYNYVITATRREIPLILSQDTYDGLDWAKWEGGLATDGLYFESESDAALTIAENKDICHSVDKDSIKICKLEITLVPLEDTEIAKFIIAEVLKKLTPLEKQTIQENLNFFEQQVNKI